MVTFTTVSIDPVGYLANQPILYRRDKVEMITRQIEGSLDDSSFKNLLLKTSSYPGPMPTTILQNWFRELIPQFALKFLTKK